MKKYPMIESTDYETIHDLLQNKAHQYIRAFETKAIGGFIDEVFGNRLIIKAYWKGYGEALITIYYSPEQKIFTFCLGKHTGLDDQLYQHLR